MNCKTHSIIPLCITSFKTTKMTPEQQRTRTKMANLARENTHRNCAIDIKQAGPHWGLYCGNPKCRKTGKWISWVKQDKVRAIIKK